MSIHNISYESNLVLLVFRDCEIYVNFQHGGDVMFMLMQLKVDIYLGIHSCCSFAA